MKIPKSLIHSICLGLSVGAVATSCTDIDPLEDLEPRKTLVKGELIGEEDSESCSPDWENCPMCGLG